MLLSESPFTHERICLIGVHNSGHSMQIFSYHYMSFTFNAIKSIFIHAYVDGCQRKYTYLTLQYITIFKVYFTTFSNSSMLMVLNIFTNLIYFYTLSYVTLYAFPFYEVKKANFYNCVVCTLICVKNCVH